MLDGGQKRVEEAQANVPRPRVPHLTRQMGNAKSFHSFYPLNDAVVIAEAANDRRNAEKERLGPEFLGFEAKKVIVLSLI